MLGLNDELSKLNEEAKKLEKVDVEKKYMDRVKEGFKTVLEYGGTGSGYIDKIYKPAGKTGTSESVYSKDITTITQTYAMFAPYDNPNRCTDRDPR